MFSCVSVCPQVMSHMTITHDALDFSIQSHPASSLHTWDLRPNPALPPSGHGTWGSPSPAPLPPCQWHLVAMTRDLFKLVHFRIPPPVLTSSGETCTIGPRGQYTSYWNDFLSFMFSNFGCDWNKCAANYCEASDTTVFHYYYHSWCQCMKERLEINWKQESTILRVS